MQQEHSYSTDTQGSRVGQSVANDVEGVDERVKCMEISVGESQIVPHSNFSGVRLIVEDQDGGRYQTSTNNKAGNPIEELQKSKLFGIQQETGFNFTLAEEAKVTKGVVCGIRRNMARWI